MDDREGGKYQKLSGVVIFKKWRLYWLQIFIFETASYVPQASLKLTI